MARCKSCGAEIVWIKTKLGRSMPCDEKLLPYREDPNGGDFVITDRGETIRCTLQFEGLPTGLARKSHWATCKYPERHRRPLR